MPEKEPDWIELCESPLWREVLLPYLYAKREQHRVEMIENFDLDTIRIAQGNAQAYDDLMMAPDKAKAALSLIQEQETEANERRRRTGSGWNTRHGIGELFKRA